MANQSQRSTAKKWYKKWWGIVVIICFLPFFATWYAWAKSSWSKGVKIAITVASGLFLIIVIATSPSQTVTPPSSSSNQPSQSASQPTKTSTPQTSTPQPKPKYEGKIVSYSPVNPATLRFVAQVTNTGDVEGKFKCTVRGKDASSTYSGFDFFEDEGGTLKPGEVRTFNGVITIKKEGAAYVTDVSISC